MDQCENAVAKVALMSECSFYFLSRLSSLANSGTRLSLVPANPFGLVMNHDALKGERVPEQASPALS